jgi:hypothetical protein
MIHRRKETPEMHFPSCCLALLALALSSATACSTPSKIDITPKDAVLDKVGASVLLRARILDQDGEEMSSRGLELGWYSNDTGVVKLTPDGVAVAVGSGSAEVRVEVAGTGVRETATVAVRIPSAVEVSLDKVRLWEGETKADVWADVRTERGAVIPGLRPTFISENPAVVKVEPVMDQQGPRSFAKLTGVSPGAARVIARYGDAARDIKVTVFAEDEEVRMVGNHISKKKERDARRGKKKKEKPLKYDF